MPATKPATLSDPPKHFRTGIARGLASGRTSPVDRTGGDYGAGIIRGFSVITRGEALGHGVFVDREFLRSTVASLNAGDGLRVRFTHPGMSSDGLGRKLGRVRSARLDGDIVRADLHFSSTSHTTPEGDLASYVMAMAEEDPALFGASIVFDADATAESAFVAANGGSGFRSPDPLNVKNLPHARLAELRAVDVVDEPAANPGGMFSATKIPAEADAMLAYALGLSSDKPAASFGIDADRLRGFAQRFMASHKLTLAPVAGRAVPVVPNGSAAGGVSLNDRTTAGDAMSQKFRGTPKVGQAFSGVGGSMDRLVEDIGVERASFSTGCGLSIADARRLFNSKLGERLHFSGHKPSEHLHDQAVASLLGIPVSEFGQAVSAGHFPEPDGKAPNKAGVKFRSWRASSVAAWAAGGCKNAKGHRNAYWANRVGASTAV